MPSESLPRERFWDIHVPKIDSQTRRLLCPSRPASVPLRHTIASSALASQHSLKWLDGVLDAYAASPLALAHDGYATSGARLLGTTSLRFALHGWQRVTKSERLSADASFIRFIRIRPKPFGSCISTAIATSSLFSAPRPRLPPEDIPPTSDSSTSTLPCNRSLPGRTIARLNFCSHAQAV